MSDIKKCKYQYMKSIGDTNDKALWCKLKDIKIFDWTCNNCYKIEL